MVIYSFNAVGWWREVSGKDADYVSTSLRLVGFLLVGCAIGWLAWGRESVWSLLWILCLPIVWGAANQRIAASMVVLGYFLAGTRGLPGGAVVFFGDEAPAWFGVVCWLGACALLTLPFLSLWSTNASARGWRFVLALCVAAVPPLGLIGWCGPALVAGVVFPGLGWVGLLATLGMMAALVCQHRRFVVVLGLGALLANLLAGPSALLPAGWQGVDTNFSRLSSAGSDDAGQILAALRRVEWIQEFAQGVPARSVRVLPETILGTVDGVTKATLQDVGETLAARGSRVLVGGELMQPDGRYKNSVLVLGAQPREARIAVQGVPVPISMWKPWANDGAVANVFGHGGRIEVAGMRASVLVCYEQLLSYSLFWSMVDKDGLQPDVLVAVSNVWWARHTSIPFVQAQSVSAAGRLFGVGVVSARNY